LNSGTGVLAMAFATPTIVCGDAFYSHEGLSWDAASKQDALRLALDETLAVDMNAVERFFHHLTDRVYSFGPSKYVERTDDQNRRIRLTEDILFNSIRGLTTSPMLLGSADSGVTLDAPLFHSFGGRQAMLRPAGANKGKVLRERREELVSKVISPIVPNRLRAKLKSNPERFFADSKSPVVRGLGKLLL